MITNRRVTPKSQDALKADAKKKFGWDLEVLDQHWLLGEDAFVERFPKEVEGVPLEFVRYFHSTPAS